MNSQNYWNNNPGKFRILVLLMSAVLISFVIYNTVNYSTTIFSGTHYMRLPSKFYVKKALILRNKNNSNDTIPVGSFLKKINEKSFDNFEDYQNTIKSINPVSSITLTIFNISKAKLLVDLDTQNSIDSLSDNYVVLKSDLPDDFIRFIPSGSFIGYIVPQGATDRAGLKAGDVLFTIKDNEIKFLENDNKEIMTIDFLKYFRNLPKDEAIPYKILRSNETQIINVWLSTFGIPTITFFVLICGLSIFILGIFYGLKRPKFIAARIISVAFVILGFEISSSLTINPPDFDLFSFLILLFNNLALIIFLPILFHSLFYFPDINAKFIKNKWYLRISYILALMTTLVFLFYYFTDFMKLEGVLITVLLAINIVYYFVIRVINSRFELSENKRVSILINSLWLLIFIISFIKPILMPFGITEYPTWTQYNFLILLSIPLVYLYFTWRYRLLDIDLNIRRNIQYFILSVLWKIILPVIFIFLLWKISNLNINFPDIKFSAISIEISSSPLEKASNIFYNKILLILIAIISGAILYKVGTKGQNFLDKKFYRDKFNYKYAQDVLIKLFQSKLTLESLAQIIVEKVSELLRVKFAGVIFSTDIKTVWEGKIFCYNNLESRSYELLFDNNFIDAIRNFRGAFTVHYLPIGIKEFLQEKNFTYIIPIRINERLLGALFIGEKLSETPLKGDDFEFLSTIVTYTSVAVENAFLYEELTKRERIKKELEIAHKIQVASLPQHVPEIPGLEIFATSIPALEVGGDFYDFLNGEINGFTIVMGDVSGKGTSAALYMSKVQGIFQTLHEFNLSPVKLLIRANKLLYKHIDSKSYITAVGANFNTEQKTMCFARAGHLPLYYYSYKLNEIRKIQPNGIGLGLSDKNIFDYSIEEIKLEYFAGDIFLLVSDGVTEAMNRAGEQFGEKRLLDLVNINHGSNSKKLVEDIMDSVQSFSSDTNQYDDITVVIVKSI